MKRNVILAGLALAVGLGACERVSSDVTGNGMARVNVRLTDAPGELSEARVQVKQVYLVGSGSDSVSAESSTKGRVMLFDGDRTYDLLTLQNGLTADLATATVPAGTYSQMRLVLGEATLTTKAGQTYSTTAGTLKCPSCAQSGLKVNLSGGGLRLDPDQHTVVLDFDVAQSFGHEAGRSGKWIMHPVINATKASTSGSIVGRVALAAGLTLPTCGGAGATVTSFIPKAVAGPVSLTTQTDAAGAFRFSNVAAGTYTMTAQDTVSFSNGQALIFLSVPSRTTATVAASDSTRVDYLVSSAVCVGL